ncbi:MAG: GDSL-type esterase/lipase family protein [Fluviicola sp.]|nr:GDSL-type esterase/lipase family protein [Fluviicola sp.]
MKIFGQIAVVVALAVACTARSQSTDSGPKDSLHTHFHPAFLTIDTALHKAYPFVNFSANCFRFYTPESPNWEKFYNDLGKMVNFKDRKLNFYHIGGSHIQADIYTHDIRTYLQTRWSDLPGERGLVFPFDLARTNNPWNYAFTSPNHWRSYKSVSLSKPEGIDFGILGAVVECSDSIIEIKFRYDKTDVKPGFTRLRIYHNKGEFPFDLHYGAAEILIVDKYHNATLGYTEAVFTDDVDTFNLQFTRNKPGPYGLQLHAVQLSNAHPGISYTAIGINGAALSTYLANRNFEEQLKESPPDFFAFSVGTNDANVPYASFNPETFKRNLEQMILKVLRANPDCAILLTVPNDAAYRRRYTNANVARERAVIIELARKYQCPVWDFYGIMGELGSSRTWMLKGLMQSDMVHFTSVGYHLKASLFEDAWEKWLQQMELRNAK